MTETIEINEEKYSELENTVRRLIDSTEKEFAYAEKSAEIRELLADIERAKD